MRDLNSGKLNIEEHPKKIPGCRLYKTIVPRVFSRKEKQELVCLNIWKISLNHVPEWCWSIWEKNTIGRYVEKKANGKKNEAVINSRVKKLYKKGVMVLVYASEIHTICISEILKNLLI